jgi:hypothetical protein
VGFERAPRDDAERARVDSARNALSDPIRLIAFEPEDACAPSGPARLTLPRSIDESSGPAGDGHPGDWIAGWTFTCAEPTALRAVRVDWFDVFSETQRIAVQWIGPAGQAGLELTPATRRIPASGR